MSNGANRLYEFGPYRMDPSRNLLLRGSEPVPLTAKAFETLLVLIEHGDQVVSKEELMKRLWPDTFVEEANLAQHISMVRKALGETPQDRRYIITLPGRGYRFAEPVRTVLGDERDLSRLLLALERCQPRHSYPEASQGGVREVCAEQHVVREG